MKTKTKPKRILSGRPAAKSAKSAPKKTKRGKLIVIDGTDGSGKATQVKLLVAKLKKEGIPVQTIDFPRYQNNTLGKLIRECLDGKHGDFISLAPRIASVLYAADRFESSNQITDWLENGYSVIADRYTSANQMHQGGKISNTRERREFLEWLDRLEHGAFKLPRPDLILYLHLPVEVSLGLIMKRAEEEGRFPDEAERNTRHLFQSQQGALAIVKDLNTWTKIDCSRDNEVLPREEIATLIFRRVKKIL